MNLVDMISIKERIEYAKRKQDACTEQGQEDICKRCGDEDIDSPLQGICTVCLGKEIGEGC